MNGLRLDVGDSYTTYTELDRDTLAMVLSAAYRDRLAPRTWWFPVVGRVPYKGFFDLDNALAEQRKLEAEGFDTYLRPPPPSARSGGSRTPCSRPSSGTTRWSSWPRSSTNFPQPPLRAGAGALQRELRNLGGQNRCRGVLLHAAGRSPDTVWCNRARDRWHDVKAFSRFMDSLVEDLEKVYGTRLQPGKTGSPAARPSSTGTCGDSATRSGRAFSPSPSPVSRPCPLTTPRSSAGCATTTGFPLRRASRGARRFAGGGHRGHQGGDRGGGRSLRTPAVHRNGGNAPGSPRAHPGGLRT